MSRGAYPTHWTALRLVVLQRAGYACECRGECGSVHHTPVLGRCAVPQHGWIVRAPAQPAQWEALPTRREGAVQSVLTTAHLCQDSTCADVTHLRALCQRCHLLVDRHQHRRNAARTRLARLEQAGQLTLWEVAP